MHPTVRVTVDNLNFCALIDTGAEVSLITRSVLTEINKISNVSTSNDSRFEIVGFSGKRSLVTETAEIKLGIGSYDTAYPHQFAVVDDGVMPYCLLLGIDFLKSYNLSIDSNKMNVKHDQVVLSSINCGTEESGNLYMVSLGEPFETSHSIMAEAVDEGLRFVIQGNSNTVTGLSFLTDCSVVDRLQFGNSQLKLVHRTVKTEVPKHKWAKKISKFKRYYSELSVIDNVLVYGNRRVVVVPFAVALELAITIHFHFSHIGRDKLISLIKDLFWHPSLTKIIHDLCSSCHVCQTMKSFVPHVQPPTLKIKTSYPFELVAIDLMSMQRSSGGYVACLMVVDHFSKFVAVVPIKDKTSKTVVNMLTKQILPFLPSVPKSILSDNGPEFTSKLFTEFMEEWNIEHRLTTPYHPQSNGAVERVNRTIQNLLKVLLQERSEWVDHLPHAVSSYNNSPHSELGMSPSRFLLSKAHDCSVDIALPSAAVSMWKLGSPGFMPFKVNDYVLLLEQRSGHLNINKFLPKYSGPYRVITVNKNGLTYVISNNEEMVNKRVHYSQLRYYKRVPNYIMNCHRYKQLCKNDPSLTQDTRWCPPVPSGFGDVGILSESSPGSAPSLPDESSTSSNESDCDQQDNAVKACDCAGCKFEHNKEKVVTHEIALFSETGGTREPLTTSVEGKTNFPNFVAATESLAVVHPNESFVDGTVTLINELGSNFSNNYYSLTGGQARLSFLDWEFEDDFNDDSMQNLIANNNNINDNVGNMLDEPEATNSVDMDESFSTADDGQSFVLADTGQQISHAMNVSNQSDDFRGFSETSLVEAPLLGLRPLGNTSNIDMPSHNNESINTRPHTRSQGSVKVLPNVQNKVLEYISSDSAI